MKKLVNLFYFSYSFQIKLQIIYFSIKPAKIWGDGLYWNVSPKSGGGRPLPCHPAGTPWVIIMVSAIEGADRMRFRNRICSLDCAPLWYHCQLSVGLNFKSFITFLISSKGTYYFTSKLPASSPLQLYKNFLPFELQLKSFPRKMQLIK